MFDIVALGELLIDFTPYGVSEKGNALFECNPGGAPANVLAGVSKLGEKTAFIGKVGKDSFGDFLKNVLSKNNIDARGLSLTDECSTTLAFVHLSESGDRSFSFVRNPGADMTLQIEDIPFETIDKSKIFHFGSVSMTHDLPRDATLKAAEYAKSKGLIVSYDPNYRPLLWENEKTAVEVMKMGLKYADILKVSEEESILLTGADSIREAANSLYNNGIKLVLITLGEKGCYYKYSGGEGRVNTYDVKVVDTTAAGDAFLAGMLYKLKLSDSDGTDKNAMEQCIRFANAAGSLATTKKGAIDTLPDLNDIEYCMKNISELVIK